MKASKYISDGENDEDSSKSAASRKRSLSGSRASADDDDNGATTKYRDFSRVLPKQQTEEVSTIIAQSATAKEPTFPVKLHMILSNPEYEDIVSWLPHGRSWRILQQKALEDRVIPTFFRHGRYSSFARQVNGWGFRRVTHGSDYNSYYHELFLRGMPHLCDKMRRLTSKDISHRKQNENEEEERAPDFYALSRENPLPADCNGKIAASNGNAQSSSADKKNAKPSSSFSSLDNSINKKNTSGSISGPRMSSSSTSTSNVSDIRLVEMELAVLDQRRHEILSRLKALADTKVVQQQQQQQQQQQKLASVVPAPTNGLNGTMFATSGFPFGLLGAGGTGSATSQALGLGLGRGHFLGSETSHLLYQQQQEEQYQRDLITLMALGERGRVGVGVNTPMMNATTSGVIMKPHHLPSLYAASSSLQNPSSLSSHVQQFSQFTNNPFGL